MFLSISIFAALVLLASQAAAYWQLKPIRQTVPGQSMTRVCAYCDLVLGEKAYATSTANSVLRTHRAGADEPLITHGICTGCFKKMMKALDEE